jgi:hypothetical protein
MRLLPSFAPLRVLPRV